MVDSRSSIDALLTEHFRYTPLSLIDDIINTVNAIIYRAIQAIESGLLSTPPSTLGFGIDSSTSTFSIPDADGEGNIEYLEFRTEIENGVHQLETLLEATADRQFDKFEIYALRNILTVPDNLASWVRLAHYGDLTLPLPASAPTTESINTLRRKLQETQKLNLALEHEHSLNAALLSQLRSMLGQAGATAATKLEDDSQPVRTAATSPLAFLAPHMSNTTSQPLTTSAQFTTAQLPALRALVSGLQPKLATLPAAAAKVDWESRRQQRREYVDGVVRKVVRDRGVEEGDEERKLGRRIGDGEVKDLERVVGGMGTEEDRMEE